MLKYSFKYIVIHMQKDVLILVLEIDARLVHNIRSNAFWFESVLRDVFIPCYW